MVFGCYRVTTENALKKYNFQPCHYCRPIWLKILFNCSLTNYVLCSLTVLVWSVLQYTIRFKLILKNKEKTVLDFSIFHHCSSTLPFFQNTGRLREYKNAWQSYFIWTKTEQPKQKWQLFCFQEKHETTIAIWGGWNADRSYHAIIVGGYILFLNGNRIDISRNTSPPSYHQHSVLRRGLQEV